MELGSLLRAEGQSVYNQLLLYLSVSYNKVFSGLAMLASKDDTYTGPKDLKTTQHLVGLTLLLLHVHINAVTCTYKRCHFGCMKVPKCALNSNYW